MLTTIRKWGNSHAIRIPQHFLEQLSLKDNEDVEIIAEKNQIVVKKIEKPDEEMTIKKLFANYHGEYQKTNIDWGEPQGKEIW